MRKYGFLRIAACVVAALPLLAGCQKSNPLLGKWQMTQNMGAMSITMTREFKDDGTETMSGPAGSMNAQMTYKVDGDKLTESVTQMSIGGNTIKVDAANLPAGAPKEMTEKFTLDGDKLTITREGGGMQMAQTYTRETTQ